MSATLAHPGNTAADTYRQAEVIRFAYRLDGERKLSGKELGALAKRMIESSDPVRKAKDSWGTHARILRRQAAFYGSIFEEQTKRLITKRP